MNEITDNLDSILEQLGHFKHIYCRRTLMNPLMDIPNLVCTYKRDTSYAMNKAELSKYIVDIGMLKYKKESDNVIMSKYNKKLDNFLKENLRWIQKKKR